MDAEWLAGLTGFALAMAATPGPNNALVMASGASYGLARTVPLMMGIALGVGITMLTVAAFGASILSDPDIVTALTWLGVIYLVWLAWRIASAEPILNGTEGSLPPDARPLSFLQGALFQLVNPKLWVMASSAVITYGQHSDGPGPMTVAALFMGVFGMTTFLCVGAWGILGTSVGRVLRTSRAICVFNGALACLLLASLVPIIVQDRG